MKGIALKKNEKSLVAATEDHMAACSLRPGARTVRRRRDITDSLVNLQGGCERSGYLQPANLT